MEFDSVSSDSDEGVELSINDHGIYCPDLPYTEEENQQVILEAKTVYLLLPKNIPVSRVARFQWLLDHLNSVITVTPLTNWNNSTEIEVVSIVPREQLITSCNKFQITCRTELKFLAHSYRIVYCLDMSPSQATIDIQKGEVLFDEIFNCFKNSIEGLTKQFTVPGNSIVFQPSIFLTIMVNTPFFMSPAQQVLVKGVEITINNLPDIIKFVGEQFRVIEGKIADVTSLAYDQMDQINQAVRNEGIVSQLLDARDTEAYTTKIPMVSPDANFVNMLRYSMLAVSLLPEYSISHILIITDGVVTMPDSNILESLLFQLHYDCISVSFLKVGSPFHPHSSSSFVSYTDLLHFFAHSTLGTCLELIHNVKHQSFTVMNVYHELFLLWSFHSKSRNVIPQADSYKWTSENEIFRGHKKPNLLTKRQAEEKSNVSIFLLLSRRLRDGFTVDHISYINGLFEVKMSLEWKSSIFIYYKVATQWPISNKNNSTMYEVFIAAPYEFLHDVTCLMKKENKSSHRVAIIERFWLRLSQLTSEIIFAQQLSTFPSSSLWYNLPESARSGLPVFVINSLVGPDNTTKTTLTPHDKSCPKFFHLWQPICQMEGNNWRKWFHMHKISLILKHDQQLPKGLHLSQSSRRYQIIQCRQAATALYGLLSEWSTLILIDNNTYLKLLYKEQDKPPISFCVIRITSKLPCAVLHVGFFTPTPGCLRKEILEQLKTDISSLAYAPGPMRTKENTICLIFEKPLEKILIRYERMPQDFSTVIFPDGTQPPHTTLSLPSPLTSSLFTTLSRYLYHKRYIWGASYSFNSRLSDNALSWILNTITKMRLEEGFHFAYSSAGIITMVMELWMEPFASCLVQYVLFPVNYSESNGWGGDSNSCSDDDNRDCDSETELQLVTEVWIEPQHGKVHTTNKRIKYLNDKLYYEVANVISQIDHKCINTLLTMEHLSLMCQERKRTFSLGSSTNLYNMSSASQKTIRKNSKGPYQESPPSIENMSNWYPMSAPRIEHIPFKFDPIAVLPFCQQTDLLFSLFIEGNERTMHYCKCDMTKANKLLMDNIHDHFAVLHDTELDLTREESDKFTRQIIERYKNKHPNSCQNNDFFRTDSTDASEERASQWRCLLKGVSVTHVILTFIPATLDDLRSLLFIEKLNCTVNEKVDSNDRPSSRTSNFSNVPINVSNSLNMPVYVYDCPLGVLVNAHVKNLDDKFNYNKDVHEDHRFRFADFFHEDCLRLKEDNQEVRSEDIDPSDPKCNAKLHCRALVLAYSKSFVLSLFVALHFESYIHGSDIQSAMDQCEESIIEIDITNYIMTVCGHVKNLKEDKIDMEILNHASPCNDLKPLHSLIREKFFQVISQSFKPIPTNNEFYFFKNVTNLKKDMKQNDSDDDLSNQSEPNEMRSDKDLSLYSERFHLQRMESGFSGISDLLMSDVYPLFLQLICTVRYNGGDSNTSVRVLPTCLGEVINKINTSPSLDKTKLQVTLDILCLTLPNKVQNVITEYAAKGLRTTSFCSDGFQPSIGSPVSENSFTEIQDLDPLVNLQEHQKTAVIQLRDDIKWLLKDEIATALLDVEPITASTLTTIVHHVSHSTGKPSCDLDKITLNFVYDTFQSYSIFMEEFAKITVPNYKLCKEEDYYYLVKENISSQSYLDIFPFNSCANDSSGINEDFDIPRPLNDDEKVKDDIASQASDISSVNGSVLTDGGYDEDVSEDYEDYEWLTNLDLKRQALPNFWLIMKIDHDVVTIYFHCRFLELPTPKVGIYLEIQSDVRDAIRELCKRVNQSLLLQSLYETKVCDSLLEPDDNFKEWHSDFVITSRSVTYNRLKSVEGLISENNIEGGEIVKFNAENPKFANGEFSCPVVWQTHFILHPRLKTGPGKSIISRGILALKNILDKFSVSNRNNMFVYKDQMNNVFYLRLQENMQTCSGKHPCMRSNEYETALVSRSPSIASLPLGQKSALGQSDASISSSASSEIRPRVRSFGEKESKNSPNEDTLILKVHGIAAAGRDVQCDLVQVLQNRLDDAVLEFLSITLARNALCPLTPEDVHFIQKPFRPPEVVIRLTVEEFVKGYLESFIHYLKQNLLQFLNIPKYTDLRSHYHFKDFPEDHSVNNMVLDDNIFIYNQSQNPSSGNRGIACIALNLINNSCQEIMVSDEFKNDLENKEYKNIISTRVIKSEEILPEVYLEFRLWKQGRVNIDNLIEKLISTVCQSAWDLVMEYFLLSQPLCSENNLKSTYIAPVHMNNLNLDLSKEIEFNVIMNGNNDIGITKKQLPNVSKTFTIARNKKRTVIPPKRKTSRSITFDGLDKEKEIVKSRKPAYKPVIELNPFEIGNEGVLCDTYSKYLPEWLEYGVALSVPTVKRHRVTISNRHLACISIRELLNWIQDTPKAFRAIPMNAVKCDDRYKYVAYTPSSSVQKCVIISRNFEHWKATVSCKESPDLLEVISPHVLKHTQKFTPLAANTFVPRQKLLWAFIESDNIIMFTYNWTKEKIDKLITNCTNLGLWLSVRACFLNSMTAQKLGFFRNQHLTRKNFLSSNNPYACYVGDLDYMRKLPKDIPRRAIANNLPRTLEVFRDAFQKAKYPSQDIVVIITIEMQEIKLYEDKWNEEMKKLHSMYQSRTSSTTVPLIFLLMQNSRIIHHCHTPLLFLPRWRIKTASTRDHTLNTTSNSKKAKPTQEEFWHTDLCYGFFCEYRRYLQTLGFMPLQFDNNQKPGLWAKDNSSYDSIFYVQKTILGGVLLFTAEFVEPFFATKLHAIECNRLQNISSRASINRFTLSFLDECDRVKNYMHLHSFTYDYHLRCIYNYISNNSGNNHICENYYLNQFLDDFLKYYNKAPNFARNLVHEDTLTIKDLLTEGNQLFNYLLQNVDQYNFKTIKMEKNNGELEEILVQVTSTSQVYYTDSQDCQHTDDFEVTVVVHNLCFPYSPNDNVLHLKYYLILTSKSELYPASGKEEKLGKFKTVSSASRSILGTLDSQEFPANNVAPERIIKTEQTEEVSSITDTDQIESVIENDEKDINHVGISTEEVNYLGYYSSHEQLMHQLILEKAKATQRHITSMVTKGMVHCRTSLLWNKLVSHDFVLTYNEFIELKSLANLELLSNIHPNLGPLLNQPVSWYEGLAKLLLLKYSEYKRSFISPDGNIQHYVMLHTSYDGAFMLLSIDLHMARGDLYAVYREIGRYEDVDVCHAYQKQLLDGFVNCIAFYLWSGMV